MRIRKDKGASPEETALIDQQDVEEAQVEASANGEAPPVQEEATEAEATPDAEAESEAEAEAREAEAGEEGEQREKGDPFASWPQAESAEVIEDAPEDVSVEHVEGEIDVPDGYSVIEGTPLGHRRTVAIVVSRFNGGLTNRLLARALEELDETGVAPDAITIVPVPGAFELPLAAMALAKTRRYACVIALGVVVRGETPHFDYVASEAASGLQLAGIETGIPVAFGVLTVNSVEQAEARIGRAADAVRSALEMADVFAQLRATAVHAE
jgi:6,7-dimethyl-8-ribityllumazine synthase